MNSGERDELLIKLFLVDMRDEGQYFNGEIIESVGFAGTEYRSVPNAIAGNYQNLTDDELDEITSSLSIRKAPRGAKSDVYINGVGYSVKSSSAAPSALVNHTSRPGFEKVCNKVGIDIEMLDEYIDEYWRLRFAGIITEDTKIEDANCPFRGSREVLTPILEYFLFTGTGSRDSNYPAQYILEFSDPSNPETWNILDPSTAVDIIWDNLVFSLRAKKGMPSDYNKETYCKPNAESIGRWTEFHSGDYRGALHIRLK